MTAERRQEIYKEVAPVNSKGRVLGQGCMSQLYVRRGSVRDSSSSQNSQSEARIKELEEQLKEAKEEQARKDAEHAKFLEDQARRDAERDAEVNELKANMVHFTAFMKNLYPVFGAGRSETQP